MPKHEGPGDEVSFIDILFAVVLGIGFEKILDKPWFKDYRGFLQLGFWTFVLAGIVVIGSWLGYHAAMKELGRGIIGGRQFLRFCIDICLLFEYARMLSRFDDLNFVLFQITVIYVWYFLWDLVSRTEWAAAHWRASILWAVWSFMLWGLEAKVRPPASEMRGFVIVFVSIASVVLYRTYPRIAGFLKGH